MYIGVSELSSASMLSKYKALARSFKSREHGEVDKVIIVLFFVIYGNEVFFTMQVLFVFFTVSVAH